MCAALCIDLPGPEPDVELGSGVSSSNSSQSTANSGPCICGLSRPACAALLMLAVVLAIGLGVGLNRCNDDGTERLPPMPVTTRPPPPPGRVSAGVVSNGPSAMVPGALLAPDATLPLAPAPEPELVTSPESVAAPAPAPAPKFWGPSHRPPRTASPSRRRLRPLNPKAQHCTNAPHACTCRPVAATAANRHAHIAVSRRRPCAGGGILR